MDFLESVVIQYLRADRALFVNTQYCLQVNAASNPDTSGPHWYCDAVVTDFRSKTIFLCEISFASPPTSLLGRLEGWKSHWTMVNAALRRESFLPDDWPVRPWIFVPEKQIQWVVDRGKKVPASATSAADVMPSPKVTPLEMVMPWHYTSWNRLGEKEKPSSIPIEMR